MTVNSNCSRTATQMTRCDGSRTIASRTLLAQMKQEARMLLTPNELPPISTEMCFRIFDIGLVLVGTPQVASIAVHRLVHTFSEIRVGFLNHDVDSNLCQRPRTA